MNFCRWASGSNCMDYPPQPQPQQNYVQVQSPPNFFQLNNSQKISVKGPEIVRERVQVRFCQPSIGCDQLNQTQPTNCGTYSQWGQQSMHTPSTFSMPKRKNSIIDGINDDSFKDLKQTNFRSTQVRQPGMYRSAFERQRLKSQQPFKRSELSNNTEPANKSSYAQLLRENYELKRIINEEYLPLKSMYARLKQQQEDREYLVSQLEWKVKELAREIKNKRI